MAADPLNSVVSDLKKNMPDAAKKKGKTLSHLPGLESALKNKAKDYKKKLQKVMKSLEDDKKLVKDDPAATKEIERVKKLLKNDERKRLTMKKSGGSKPS